MVMEVENRNTVKKWDTRDREKEASVAFRVLKRNKLNGHRYKQMLKQNGRKSEESDFSVEKKSRLSRSEFDVTESNETEKDENADADNSVSNSRREGLDFLLRQVKIDGHVKNSDGLNLPIQSKVVLEDTMSLQEKKIDESEILINMDGPTKPNFVEYWVPVELSEMQTEQYCGTLFSNTDILCSCDSNEVLNEMLVSMLVSTKKCCDHPYLVDGSLCTSLIQDTPDLELLDAEIKLSNKLLLLHKILLEIKKRGLRVLILYQSFGGSQSFSLGDILEEFIEQTLGKDTYEHIVGCLRISRSKRLGALKSFNDKANKKFVCLMETRSCIPSIKLSSIDTVIFFNSDWNPINDLKALQRIELNSRFEDVNVFRFYSYNTLEEKVLILAKQGTALEGCNILSDIKQSMCHQLLTWGVSYLFEKLDEFHDNISNNDGLQNVFVELLNLLPDNEETCNSTVCGDESSYIVKAKQADGIYSRNISLRGELEKDSLVNDIPLSEIRKMVDPHVFWTELLEERSPRWKYFSIQSRRATKKVQRFEDLLEPPSKKRRREVKSTFYQITTTIMRKARSKVRNRGRRRKLVPRRRVDDRREPIRTANEPREESNAIIVQSTCKALEIELEGLQKQKTELLKLHEEKKLRIKTECENEIDRIRKKYDTMLENAETGLMEEKGVIDAKYNKVYVNKLLAEAVINAESTTLSQVTSGYSVEEMHRLFSQWTGSKKATRPEQVVENLPNQARLASRSDQHSGNLFPAFPNLVISPEVASCLPIGQSRLNQPLSNLDNIGPSMNLTSSVQIPQTLVSPMSIKPFGFSGNVPARYSTRAPAPHFRHMRPPPQPVTAPKMSSPGPGVFSNVSARPVTSNVQSLQSIIDLPLLWEI